MTKTTSMGLCNTNVLIQSGSGKATPLKEKSKSELICNI
jgi:hypothetical protein